MVPIDTPASAGLLAVERVERDGVRATRRRPRSRRRRRAIVRIRVVRRGGGRGGGAGGGGRRSGAGGVKAEDALVGLGGHRRAAPRAAQRVDQHHRDALVQRRHVAADAGARARAARQDVARRRRAAIRHRHVHARRRRARRRRPARAGARRGSTAARAPNRSSAATALKAFCSAFKTSASSRPAPCTVRMWSSKRAGGGGASCFGASSTATWITVAPRAGRGDDDRHAGRRPANRHRRLGVEREADRGDPTHRPGRR